MDVFDGMVVIGLLLLGLATWLVLGSAATLAYAGVVLAVAGAVGAQMKARRG